MKSGSIVFWKNSIDVIVVLDENGTQLAIHGQMELITGYGPEELLGASGFEKSIRTIWNQ